MADSSRAADTAATTTPKRAVRKMSNLATALLLVIFGMAAVMFEGLKESVDELSVQVQAMQVQFDRFAPHSEPTTVALVSTDGRPQ